MGNVVWEKAKRSNYKNQYIVWREKQKPLLNMKQGLHSNPARPNKETEIMAWDGCGWKRGECSLSSFIPSSCWKCCLASGKMILAEQSQAQLAQSIGWVLSNYLLSYWINEWFVDAVFFEPRLSKYSPWPAASTTPRNFFIWKISPNLSG